MIPNTKLMLRKTEKCKQAEVFKQSRVSWLLHCKDVAHVFKHTSDFSIQMHFIKRS